MRVAFCGKGGSGKTTVTSLFARYLAKLGLPVIAMDGDINQHLGSAIGLSREELQNLPKLGNEIERLQEYVRGTNERIESAKHIIKTAPPGQGSQFFHFDRSNEITNRYETRIGDIRFMAVGGFDDEKIGTTCFHSYSAAMNIYLNHLIDQDNEYFLGDMSAGADPFTTGLITRFDVAVIVTEPTLKSVSVYDQCKEYGAPFGIKIAVVGNKIQNERDVDFIRSRVGDDFLTAFQGSDYVRAMEQGIRRNIDELESENKKALETAFGFVKGCKRDWERLLLNNIEFHKRAADNWASAVYETDLNKQVDPNFSYEQVLPVKAG